MEELPKLHFLILVVIGHVVIADQVRDGRERNGCLEFIGLRNQPFRELAAVTSAFNPHALAVDPKISSHGSAYPVENILSFVAILIAKDRVGKFQPVTS